MGDVVDTSQLFDPESRSPAYPFKLIRARFLLSALIVAGLTSAAVAWGWAADSMSPWPMAAAILAQSSVLFGVTAWRAKRAGLLVSDLFFEFPPRRIVVELLILGLPMLGLALIGTYALYVPLSLVFPGAIQAWLFQDQPVLYGGGSPYPVSANVVGFLGMVVLTPLAEEWFFRGLLLRRWVYKWSPRTAVLTTSALFALLHLDPIGAFVFGIVMCGLYARYRSLWPPVIVHASNNLCGWLLAALEAHGVNPIDIRSIDDMRAAWWVAAAGALLVLPWARRGLRAWRSVRTWEFSPRVDLIESRPAADRPVPTT